jgi:hypothetical protein
MYSSALGGSMALVVVVAVGFVPTAKNAGAAFVLASRTMVQSAATALDCELVAPTVIT